MNTDTDIQKSSDSADSLHRAGSVDRVEEILRTVLDKIRNRQRQLSEQADKFSAVCALESRDVMLARKYAIEEAAQWINEERFKNSNPQNAAAEARRTGDVD